MPGYKAKTQKIDFPDISEDDDPIWITIRNPKLLAPDFFDGGVDLPDPPKTDGMNDEQIASAISEWNRVNRPLIIQRSREVMANLIVDWHVYDATVDEATEPLGKPSVETVALLPWEIVTRLNKVVEEVVNPT